MIPLAHEEIAHLAGTSRVTVSRVLSQEQRDRTIASGRRTIAVLDVARLKRRAEWPDDSVPAALRGT